MRNIRNIGLSLAGIVCLIALGSWGFKMHRLINNKACYVVPDEMKGFFKLHAEEITKRSTAPDERRNATKGEAPKHFVDIEYFPEADRMNLPHGWQEAVVRYGLDSLERWGYVPWQIQHSAYKLTKAFEIRKSDSIIFYAADLGDYVADAHVPFHTTVNYDGQLTGQKGIHSLYESLTPTIFADTMVFNLREAQYLDAIAPPIFDAVYRAHALLPAALEKERQAKASLPETDWYTMSEGYRGPSKKYSLKLIAAYHDLLTPTVEIQAVASAQLLANLWYTCWVNAGQPDLNYADCDCKISAKKSLINAIKKLFCGCKTPKTS